MQTNQQNTAVAADPLTIAYMALGAGQYWSAYSANGGGKYTKGGQLEFIGEVIEFANLADQVAAFFDLFGEHPGVFAYDVAESFGSHLAEVLCGGGELNDEMAEQLLHEVMFSAGYAQADLDHAFLAGSVVEPTERFDRVFADAVAGLKAHYPLLGDHTLVYGLWQVVSETFVSIGDDVQDAVAVREHITRLLSGPKGVVMDTIAKGVRRILDGGDANPKSHEACSSPQAAGAEAGETREEPRNLTVSEAQATLEDGTVVDLLAIQSGLCDAFLETGLAKYAELADQMSLLTRRWMGQYGDFLPGTYLDHNAEK